MGQTIKNTSGTFQVPAGITTMTIRCWGSGGTGFSGSGTGGGGGGGGAYSEDTIAVTPLEVLDVTATTSSVGEVKRSGTTLVKADNGRNSSGSTGGVGGLTANGVGSVKTAGGDGGTGATSGGGGGGSGGNTGAGGNGTGATGGAAGSGTGINSGAIGGAGGAAFSNGAGGTVPGSGGGGGGQGGGLGVAGAAGRVIFDWIDPPSTATCGLIVGAVTHPSILAATATFAAGTYTATAGLGVKAAALDATAFGAAPSYTAASALSTTRTILDANATFGFRNTATADLSRPAVVLVATATFVKPTYTGTFAKTIGPATLAALAFYANSIAVGHSSLLVGPATLATTATFVGPGGIFTVQVGDGLDGRTDYDAPFTVRIGSSTTAPFTVQIAETAIEPPEDVLAYHLGQGAVIVTWTHPDEEAVDYYQTEVALASGGPYFGMIGGQTSNIRTVLRNLPLGRTVYIRVRAIGLNGTISSYVSAKLARLQTIEASFEVSAISGSSIPNAAKFALNDQQTGLPIVITADGLISIT